VVTIVRPVPWDSDPGSNALFVLFVHSNTVFGSLGALQLKQFNSVVHIAGSITLKLVVYAEANGVSTACVALLLAIAVHIQRSANISSAALL
jgi:hypothetical protein